MLVFRCLVLDLLLVLVASRSNRLELFFLFLILSCIIGPLAVLWLSFRWGGGLLFLISPFLFWPLLLWLLFLWLCRLGFGNLNGLFGLCGLGHRSIRLVLPRLLVLTTSTSTIPAA
jgi:hypothetical protein